MVNSFDLIPTDISNELGFDYLKEDELSVKKKKIDQNDMHLMFHALNIHPNEFAYGFALFRKTAV